jgi:hypothetical protein
MLNRPFKSISQLCDMEITELLQQLWNISYKSDKIFDSEKYYMKHVSHIQSV